MIGSLRTETTPSQQSNHRDDQDHDKKQMDETPDGGALVRITVPYVAPEFSQMPPVRRGHA